MNLISIFFNSFQRVERNLHDLSSCMQNNPAAAVTIFGVANSALFSFVTMISNVQTEQKWTYRQILTHGMMVGLTFAGFNILLSRLTKYALNGYVLTAIAVSTIFARLVMIVFENQEIEQKYIERELKKQEQADAEVARARIAAEKKAPTAAAEKARMEAEEKAQAEATEKARIETEEKAHAEATEKASRKEAAKKALAARQARIEAEEQAQAEAIEKTNKEEAVKKDLAVRQARMEAAAEKARIEAEKKAQAEAAEKPRIETEKKLLKIADIDPELRLLADAVKNDEEKAPFPRVYDYWKNKSVKHLKFRHQFALVFGSEESERYKDVRKIFADKVYQPLPRKINITWLSSNEVEKQLQDALDNQIEKANCEVFGSGYYYHSTHLDALESILKNGEVRLGARLFKGAFVSTSPFYCSYPYVLVFKRIIEHLSTLMHGFMTSPDYWAGFSHPIPVNQITLAHILKKDNEKSNHEIELLCEKWTGRKIKVIGEKEYFAKWKYKIEALNMGIPSHWEEQTFGENHSHEKVEMNFNVLEKLGNI